MPICTDHDILASFGALFPRGGRRAAVTMVALCLFAASANIGCSEDREFRDVGRLCLYPPTDTERVPGFSGWAGDNTTPASYPADQPVQVAVQFPTCLSGSCSTNQKASCTATFAPGSRTHLVVSSRGSFEERTSGSCSTDCRFLIARCSTPTLGSGSYTFAHGDDTLALTVPSSGPPPCVESAAP